MYVTYGTHGPRGSKSCWLSFLANEPYCHCFSLSMRRFGSILSLRRSPFGLVYSAYSSGGAAVRVERPMWTERRVYSRNKGRSSRDGKGSETLIWLLLRRASASPDGNKKRTNIEQAKGVRSFSRMVGIDQPYEYRSVYHTCGCPSAASDETTR